jgi:hypothetical protein
MGPYPVKVVSAPEAAALFPLAVPR